MTRPRLRRSEHGLNTVLICMAAADLLVLVVLAIVYSLGGTA